jgi:hypothetical protein
MYLRRKGERGIREAMGGYFVSFPPYLHFPISPYAVLFLRPGPSRYVNFNIVTGWAKRW